MKSTLLWMLRHLLIPAGFIWSTGIITGIISLNKESKSYKDPTQTFTAKELATLEMTPKTIAVYGDSLIQERERHIKETGMYEPFLYFHDLKQYKMFKSKYQDSLALTLEGRSLIMSCLEGLSLRGLHKLVNLRDENWRNIDFDNVVAQNYTQHAGYKRKMMGVDEAKYYWFPGEALRDKAQENSHVSVRSDIVLPFLHWLLMFYLRGLPLAFLLFLIWKYNLKREFIEATWQKDITVHFAPLSFLLSVLIWPIILWIDIKNRGKEALQKAEVISRRENLLSLFSKQEQKMIELGKTMGWAEFQKQLDSMEITRKHALIKALFVMVVISLVPRYSVSQPSYQSCTVQRNLPVQKVGISENVHKKCFMYSITCNPPPDTPVVDLEKIISKKTKKIITFINLLYRNTFFPDIEKIPIFTNQYNLCFI
jgi:hypothetical protein